MRYIIERNYVVSEYSVNRFTSRLIWLISVIFSVNIHTSQITSSQYIQWVQRTLKLPKALHFIRPNGSIVSFWTTLKRKILNEIFHFIYIYILHGERVFRGAKIQIQSSAREISILLGSVFKVKVLHENVQIWNPYPKTWDIWWAFGGNLKIFLPDFSPSSLLLYITDSLQWELISARSKLCAYNLRFMFLQCYVILT